MNELRIQPAYGYAIIRREVGGLSPGGVIMPETADETRLYMVASSEGWVADGNKVLSPYRPGDRIVLAPKAGMVRTHDMPKEYFIVMLLQIVGFGRASGQDH